MGLFAGDLRNRVTICKKTVTPQGTGRVEDWNDYATIWANVVGLNGREAVIAQALQGVSYYRVTIRFRTDITDIDQLRYDSIDLNIRSIADPDGRREQLQILADTGSAEATGGG